MVSRTPPLELTDVSALLVNHLAYYRSEVLDRLDGLSDAQLHASIVPSGWTPLELLNHLIFMERRWVQWGFAGRPLPDPRGDRDETGQFVLPIDAAATTLPALTAALLDTARETERVVARAGLEDRSRAGGHFDGSEPLPSLGWILLHVLQEYAQHVGQLDIIRELIDSSTGK